MDHWEEVVPLKTDSEIEGVTFDGEKIIVLLKNGQYWEVGGREYRFERRGEWEGDLCFIRDKNSTNFFKSGLKKIRGMSKPALSILEEATL